MKRPASIFILFLALFSGFTPVTGVGAENDSSGDSPAADSRAYWHYANALYAQRAEDIDRALAEFQQAAHFDPQSSAIHDSLAQHYLVAGLAYKSVEELRKSIELNPLNFRTRLFLARLLEYQGEFGKAQKVLQEILDKDPKNIDARNYLGVILANQNKTDEALQVYQKILLDNPKGNPKEAADVYNHMGLLYTKLGRASDAEEAFRKAVELDPSL